MQDDGAAFRTMFEYSPAAQLLVYRDRAGLVANEALAALFGYERDAFDRLTLADLVHEQDQDELVAQQALLESGEASRATIERRYLRADGSTFVGRALVSAVRNDNGNVEYLLGVIVDITEELRAAEALAASEAQFRALVDNSADIIITVHPDGQWTGSGAGAQLLGYTNDVAVPGGALAVVHPDDVDRAAAVLAEIRSTPGFVSAPVELRLRSVDGRYLDFECVGRNFVSKDAVGCVIVTARHLAERKRMEQALHAAEAQFRAVFEHAPFSVSVLDLDGRIIDINYAGCAMLDRTRQDLAGTLATGVLHPDDVERAIDVATRQLSGNPTPAEFRVVRADGTSLWVMSSASLVDPGGEDDPYVVSVQADITDRRTLEARLEREATRDQLTGVMNRGALMTQLELALLQRHTSLLGVLFVDLDYFKMVNDTFGHEAGDAVLSTIAKRIQDNVREGDVVGRLGGDEFVVLCQDVTGLSEAMGVAQRLRDAVAQPISIRGGTAQVDASVGVTLGCDGDDAASIMRRVDKASYQAKADGRGRVVAAEDELDGGEAAEPLEEVKRSA